MWPKRRTCMSAGASAGAAGAGAACARKMRHRRARAGARARARRGRFRSSKFEVPREDEEDALEAELGPLCSAQLRRAPGAPSRSRRRPACPAYESAPRRPEHSARARATA